ncbi:MAG: succinyldiaminopimelate transaminase [Cellvibrionaceae bacterium]
MNPDLALLQPYPFEKLNALKAQVTPPADLPHIALSIGEPKHTPPQFVLDELSHQQSKVAVYPATKGLPELRESIATWTSKRFHLQDLNAESQVLPVNGTREALFAFAQAVVDRTQPNALVVSPNPFYQIYEGAAYLAGATPHYLNCLPENNYIPDFAVVPEDVWQRTQLLFICTPGNPTGAVIPMETLKQLIALADKHNFVIASDECYSELYFDEENPPVGLLQACAELGRHDYKNCVVFHSLSKRSNLPGLRSGFVAGDADILKKFLLYRTYHGCAMPVHSQLASIAAWNDETHVKANRDLYREKFDKVLTILDGCLDVKKPDASFYLYPKTPIADTEFAQRLFAEKNITALPASFLSRETNGVVPGENHVRMALVATVDECVEAAHRIKAFVESL